MAQRRVQAVYTGHVQGVGFRFSVDRIAADYPVTGYVMNLPNGSVELVAEGGRAQLQSFIDAISESHLGGYIRDTHVDWSESTGAFAEFAIRTNRR